MLSKDTIAELRARCAGRNNCSIDRSTFCALVRESETTAEGPVMALKALERAHDIVDPLCVECKDVRAMLDEWEAKHTGESNGANV